MGWTGPVIGSIYIDKPISEHEVDFAALMENGVKVRGATRGPKFGFSRSIPTLAENRWGGRPGAPRTRGARWGGLETVFVRFTAIRAKAPIFGSFER